MRSLAARLAVCSAAFAISTYGQGKQFHLGRNLTPAQERRWDITVLPDGRGLPKGSGTASQGKKIYMDKCSGCHGNNGEGRMPLGGRLVGGIGTLKSAKPIVTIGSFWPYSCTIWDYIFRAMPKTQPGTLSSNETYALTAFLLYRNGIIPRGLVLNRETLPRIRMPNQDGFFSDQSLGVKLQGQHTLIPQ